MEQPRDDPKAGKVTRLHRLGESAARVGSLQAADPNLRRGLQAAVTVTVLLAAALAIAGALDRWPDVDWAFSPGWIALGVGGMVLYLLAAAELWRRLVESLGPPLRPAAALPIWFASALGRYVPTGLLVPMMRMAMGEREGLPKRICLVSTVYELALTLSAALVAGAYFVIDLPDLADQPARFAVLIVPALAMVCLHPRIFHRATDYALIRLGRDPLPISLGTSQLLAYLVVYALTFVLAGASTYGLAECVYPDLAGDDAVIVFGSFAVATALSLLGFLVPGGLGVREAGMVLALSPAMPTAPAIAVAILSRVTQIGLEIGFTLIGQVAARRSTRAYARRA